VVVLVRVPPSVRVAVTVAVGRVALGDGVMLGVTVTLAVCVEVGDGPSVAVGVGVGGGNKERRRTTSAALMNPSPLTSASSHVDSRPKRSVNSVCRSSSSTTSSQFTSPSRAATADGADSIAAAQKRARANPRWRLWDKAFRRTRSLNSDRLPTAAPRLPMRATLMFRRTSPSQQGRHSMRFCV
jgi:hypothetical protein